MHIFALSKGNNILLLPTKRPEQHGDRMSYKMKTVKMTHTTSPSGNEECHIEIFINGKLEESFVTFRKGNDNELIEYYTNIFRSRYITF